MVRLILVCIVSNNQTPKQKFYFIIKFLFKTLLRLSSSVGNSFLMNNLFLQNNRVDWNLLSFRTAFWRLIQNTRNVLNSFKLEIRDLGGGGRWLDVEFELALSPPSPPTRLRCDRRRRKTTPLGRPETAVSFGSVFDGCGVWSG